MLLSYSNFLDPASTSNSYFPFNCSKYRERLPPPHLPNNSTINFQLMDDIGNSINLLFHLENVISVTICEHQRRSISCEGGATIIVLEASYGRHDRHTCPHSSIRTTNCNAASSLSVVQGNCDDQGSCTLFASNSVFGDPCVGTFKYLQVKYKCIGGTVTHQLYARSKGNITAWLKRKQKFDKEKNSKKFYTLALGLVPSDS